MKKQTVIFFYILSVYVVLQFGWWTYHLIDLSSKLGTPELQRKQSVMILGEGFVFFLLLMLGIWKIRSSIQKEIIMSKRQSNFLLSVTHELKTPIVSNKLYIQTLLKRRNLDSEQQTSLLEKALEENQRLEDMIEDILTATKIENQHFKVNVLEYNLSREFARIVDDWSETRIPVNLDIEQGIVEKVDLLILETALNNLLSNALKYGGENPQIEVYLKKERNQLTWGVKDQGQGISAEERKDIFNKFVRIGNEETRKQKGTGLGLYIVKNLLLLQGDTIEFIPNSPKGSHFKVVRGRV